MDKEQMEKINVAIKNNIKRRKEIAGFNSFLRMFKEKEIEKKFLISQTLVMFNIITLEELKTMRKILRREFNIWEDELVSVNCWFNSYEKDYEVFFYWKGKHLPIRIELGCFKEKMPEELKSLKPGCEFKETIENIEAHESKSMSYVCST